MLSLIAAMMMYPPVDVVETTPVDAIPYEFAFQPNALETDSEASERLRSEAAQYCRKVTREAGLSRELGNCTRTVVDQMSAAIDDARAPAFASNR